MVDAIKFIALLVWKALRVKWFKGKADREDEQIHFAGSNPAPSTNIINLPEEELKKLSIVWVIGLVI